MYVADNTEISVRYVRSLNYTFYPLRDLPHFASCGPQIPFKITLIGVYGLNLSEVGKLLVPSIPVKLSHMDISVEI